MNIAKCYGMSYDMAMQLNESFIAIHCLAEEKKGFIEWYGYSASV